MRTIRRVTQVASAKLAPAILFTYHYDASTCLPVSLVLVGKIHPLEPSRVSLRMKP